MGLIIILVTSRVESERAVTEKSLKKYGIQYDALIMDKPRGFIYVDDLAHRFDGWDKTLHEIIYRWN